MNYWKKFRLSCHGYAIQQFQQNGDRILLDSADGFEEALDKARRQHQSTGKTVGVTDCRSGQILFRTDHPPVKK